MRLVHADTPVLHREQLPPAAAGVAASADGHGHVRRGEPDGVLRQLGEQVREVGNRRAAAERALRDLERHPVEVLGLRDRRTHDVAQRDRLAPHPRGLLAREHGRFSALRRTRVVRWSEAEQLASASGFRSDSSSWLMISSWR